MRKIGCYFLGGEMRQASHPQLGEEDKQAPPPLPVIIAAPKPQISWTGGDRMMEPSNKYIKKSEEAVWALGCSLVEPVQLLLLLNEHIKTS